MPSHRRPTAVLFPGQASQTPGMRDAVGTRRPDLLDAAAEAVGDDPFARVEEGTQFAQPAIYCANLTAWSSLDGIRPEALAGHSLGEFAALVAAGSLDEGDGLRLVVLRGRLMAQAAESSGDGSMLALLGTDREEADEIAERHGVTVANDNAPGQIVLSGPSERLARAAREAGERERKAVHLKVAGAFHSPAMESAVPAFRAALDETRFLQPRVPVFSCLTAAPFDHVRERLAQGLVRPVRWRETLVRLRDREGVRSFLETGPGKVLTNLVRRTLDGVEARSVAPMDGPDA
jgi:[acyl-carrier-protein] S-malonyltransferase